jgi:putative ABC transport system ATP-binding protein
LANDPEAIFADEPTGSLDSAAGESAIRLLHDAARVDGRAVVVVSHDTRIKPYADRVLQMIDGRLSS